MIIIAGIFIGIYCLYWLILDFYFWKKEKSLTKKHLPYCSIIICAYNEEENIEQCLNSLIKQKEIENYAEIILVNDASKDNTLIKANCILKNKNIPYKIIDNKEKTGKKKCIEKAVECTNEKSEYIILRDADTYTLSNEWFIQTLKQLNDTDLLIMPVITCIKKQSWIEYLQYYEGLALMHLTLASLNLDKPILCNAANMAFRKEKFKALQPYKNNYHLFSGDDIFLLQKFHLSGAAIKSGFTDKQIVYTYSPENILQLFRQKTRWLSKTAKLNNPFNTLSALIIVLCHLTLSVILFFSPIHFALLFLIKMAADFKIIFSVKKRLNLKADSAYHFFVAQLLYIPYVCALIFIHFLSNKKK